MNFSQISCRIRLASSKFCPLLRYQVLGTPGNGAQWVASHQGKMGLTRWWLPTHHFEGLSYIQMAESGYITKGSSCRATLSCTFRAQFAHVQLLKHAANSRVWHLSGLSPSANHSRGNNCFNFFEPCPPPMWVVGLHLIPKSFTSSTSSTSPTFHLGLPFLFPSSYVGMTRYDCKVMVIMYLHFFAAPSSDASEFIHVYPIIRHSPGSP